MSGGALYQCSLYLLICTMLGCTILIVYHYWPPQPYVRRDDEIEKYYDFIIVGGGTAGCVLADRLTRDESYKVLVLEAGEDDIKTPMFDIPLMVTEQQMTNADWKYYTESQKSACLALKNNQSYWPRGKVVGGSSNLNFMLYSRGSKYDYDKWAANGCKGWTYEEVLPYFIKSEANMNPRYVKSGYHGRDGPLVVSDVTPNPVTSAFMSAGRELGHPTTDLNGEIQLGQMYAQALMRRGSRWSVSRAYLRPALTRDNLHLVTNAHVHRVLFKGTRAIGVEFERNGTMFTVKSRREIAITTGTLESPKLLMLSGIGPKNHLSSMGINVVLDQPAVGENLQVGDCDVTLTRTCMTSSHQDHVFTDAVAFLTDKGTSITKTRARSVKALIDYFVFGKGMLTSPAAVEALGFYMPRRHAAHAHDHPHLQLSLMASHFGEKSTKDFNSIRNRFNYDPQVFREMWGDLTGTDGMMILPMLLHPQSRGRVRLKSADPYMQPQIQPNYLTDSEDVRGLLEGIRIAQQYTNTNAFQRIGARALRRHHPRCKMFKYDSDGYWSCYIRHNTLTAYHAAGTCRMGGLHDNNAVVDFKFRVRGVKGLRVVDASVMPNITSGNIHAPVVMFAERAADWMMSVPPPEKVVLPHQGLRDEL